MAKMHLQRPVVVGSNRPGSAFTAVYPGSVAAVLDRWSTVCVDVITHTQVIRYSPTAIKKQYK